MTDNGHTYKLRQPRASLAIPVLEGVKQCFDAGDDGKQRFTYPELVRSPIYQDVLAFLADTVEDTTAEYWDRQHPVVTMKVLNQCVQQYREGAKISERLEYSKN